MQFFFNSVALGKIFKWHNDPAISVQMLNHNLLFNKLELCSL